ncbi:hypothetical protein JXC34_02765 [Candidatus Woesearchaeota archaeon]|nr:hypothetical protein [Candidatus Woesearchaeota archaeon]
MDKQIAIMFFFMLIFSSTAHSYGMASEFLEDNTMVLNPGESKEYNIELQNVDQSELTFNFLLESKIAELKENFSEVTIGKDKPFQTISLVIKVPEDAKPGDQYSVRYSAVPVSVSDGPINLNIKLNNEFKVIVPVDNELSSLPEYFRIFSGFLLLTIIILVIFRKNKLLSGRLFKK